MATFRIRDSSWQVQIRKSGHPPVTRTFRTKSNAHAWSRQVEADNMRQIRSEGMKPELTVRKLVHSLGYRYRLHQRDLPGNPDQVFRRRRKVIFVHGCFWHQHNDPNCKVVSRPKSNTSYWNAKLDRNVERDLENVRSLDSAGWEVFTVWECEVADSGQLAKRIRLFLDD